MQVDFVAADPLKNQADSRSPRSNPDSLRIEGLVFEGTVVLILYQLLLNAEPGIRTFFLILLRGIREYLR